MRAVHFVGKSFIFMDSSKVTDLHWPNHRGLSERVPWIQSFKIIVPCCSMAIHYEYVMVLLLWGQTQSSLQGPGARTLLCMASVEFLDLTTGRATNWLCALWIASMHCLQGFPNFPNETARSVNSWNSCLSGSIEQAVSSFFCWPSRTWWTQSAKRWDTGEAFCNTCAPLKAPLGTWRWLTGLTWLTGRYHIWGLLVDEGTYEPVVLGTTPLKDWAVWAPSKHSRGMFQFFTVTLGEVKILPVGFPNDTPMAGWFMENPNLNISKMDDLRVPAFQEMLKSSQRQ